MTQETQYTEENIRSLDWREHIRLRPGMYIGKLGDGTSADDGIYILLKEVVDNCIDEFVMGAGKTIEISIKDQQVSVRDYGRGIPLGKVVDVVSKMNTGGKYDSRAFKKSVGLNGVGTKAVNALSSSFIVESVRDQQSVTAEFHQGELSTQTGPEESGKKRGTRVTFVPDETIFKNYKYRSEYVVRMIKNYVYLNPGLTLVYNGEKYFSEYGLKDLIEDNNKVDDLLYPVIHLKGPDIEVAITHSKTSTAKNTTLLSMDNTPHRAVHTRRRLGRHWPKRSGIFTGKITRRLTSESRLFLRFPSKSWNRCLKAKPRRSWALQRWGAKCPLFDPTSWISSAKN